MRVRIDYEGQKLTGELEAAIYQLAQRFVPDRSDYEHGADIEWGVRFHVFTFGQRRRPRGCFRGRHQSRTATLGKRDIGGVMDGMEISAASRQPGHPRYEHELETYHITARDTEDDGTYYWCRDCYWQHFEPKESAGDD